ncbi:MAG: alkylhydroperoxidase [Thalassospira sp.]|uniref:carboxymuconolactone decarboxylase family protein n=1 Tax=Thalassospira sp. TaxID=1912094 RepID=UPI000C358981|nr:carboxymuconolactone decarboxylase family protein [Thalassospira sp.]MAZ31928.1 alkylhydroperoxidase [Thalassospira sp.]|tara:strand:- start:69 stop:503 length:435 start_codon:yes stop_codon:yes gene_type:complete
MAKRLNIRACANEGIKALAALETWLAGNFDGKLLELVRRRASQINGCAFCQHISSEKPQKLEEFDNRLLLLNVWRKFDFFSPRERAALAWTEALTLVAGNEAPDEVYEEVSREFSDDELVALSIAIGMINVWNRLSIGFQDEDA